MPDNPFQTRQPKIEGNALIRDPQRAAHNKLVEVKATGDTRRELGIVLPVGCGKSGCITLAPFAFESKRTLVVAPGTRIAKQLHDDFDPTRPEMFYIKCAVLDGAPYPEPVEIRGTKTNTGDLDEAHVVITNIHQLQGPDNRWLGKLRSDYFDLIIFDEGHHSVAETWANLKDHFPRARIINYSATPLRADGQRMAGDIIYSYPVADAIEAGYCKRLKALVLNPASLRYVRREDGQEIEVALDEVRRLGEQEADFRRSIVTSTETLNTIVDASIRELQRLRASTGEKQLKIIASALNYEHCIQVVEAYRARGQRADYVHSRADSAANDRVFDKLDNHGLDVIVQVRKLGEGFDHPYLSVAAVFSIFANLSPFIQFVGRIMRVIQQGSPGHALNQGTVVFHAGSNIASRWDDFREYSDADQEYFSELLPVESLDFSNASELHLTPRVRTAAGDLEVRSQSAVRLQEIPLLERDDVKQAFETLREHGVTADQARDALLQPVPTTRVRERQAARVALDARIRNEVGRILGERNVNHEGHDLDKKRLGRTNFQVLITAINRRVYEVLGHGKGERHEFSRQELDGIKEQFGAIVSAAEKEVFDG
ncbi:MAG: DEAD/DEAH box helicase family protein [Phycisphaerales bacterium]|nr:DEAD/DEAH box helicase family protein [Phycisphaerales bacterium]